MTEQELPKKEQQVPQEKPIQEGAGGESKKPSFYSLLFNKLTQLESNVRAAGLKAKMKVMQILPKMNVGGVERGVVDLVRYLGSGKDIEHIVVSGGGRLADDLKHEGAICYQLAVYKKSPTSIFLIPRLRKIIEREGVDIIHARSRVPAWISFFASRKSNTHFITTAHGVYKNKWWSEVMGWGKFVICPSRGVARHMHTTFGVPEEKIIVINRWVDVNRFTFLEYKHRRKSNIIVSIGRISPSKGYEHLIEAFKKVIRFQPYFSLKIVGSPDPSKMHYFHYLKTLVRRFSLDYNVQFVGFRSDVENVLRSARILVAPSVDEESFGRVVVEAFACGVPVIATNVGGFSEIIEDGKDGILVDPQDASALAESIVRLLGDEQLAESMVGKARKKVNALYVMDKCLEETKAVYVKTLASLRILVVKISSFGDLILALPSLKAIRQRFPKARVSLLTSKKYSTLVYDCPYIDEVITLSENYKHPKNILRIAKELRRKSFDYIIDLQNNRISHLISCLALPRYSFGYSLKGGALLTHRIPYNREDGPLASQERILSLLGITFREKKLIFWDQKEKCKSSFPSDNLIG
ncbi:MAG: glycosyltransferase, partial [Candidatus Omnitrophota bacterium]